MYSGAHDHERSGSSTSPRTAGGAGTGGCGAGQREAGAPWMYFATRYLERSGSSTGWPGARAVTPRGMDVLGRSRSRALRFIHEPADSWRCSYTGCGPANARPPLPHGCTRALTITSAAVHPQAAGNWRRARRGCGAGQAGGIRSGDVPQGSGTYRRAQGRTAGLRDVPQGSGTYRRATVTRLAVYPRPGSAGVKASRRRDRGRPRAPARWGAPARAGAVAGAADGAQAQR
jgi:hypothetical protein